MVKYVVCLMVEMSPEKGWKLSGSKYGEGCLCSKGGGGKGGLRIGLTRQLESCQPGNQTM